MIPWWRIRQREGVEYKGLASKLLRRYRNERKENSPRQSRRDEQPLSQEKTTRQRNNHSPMNTAIRHVVLSKHNVEHSKEEGYNARLPSLSRHTTTIRTFNEIRTRAITPPHDHRTVVISSSFIFPNSTALAK